MSEKIQILERHKRNKNRLQMRGPLHPKGYRPLHKGLPVEPGYKPMPGGDPGHFRLGDFLTGLKYFFTPWGLRARKRRQFEPPKELNKR
jgi:hypothetical protein